jgi:hypothetical protein
LEAKNLLLRLGVLKESTGVQLGKELVLKRENKAPDNFPFNSFEALKGKNWKI